MYDVLQKPDEALTENGRRARRVSVILPTHAAAGNGKPVVVEFDDKMPGFELALYFGGNSAASSLNEHLSDTVNTAESSQEPQATSGLADPLAFSNSDGASAIASRPFKWPEDEMGTSGTGVMGNGLPLAEFETQEEIDDDFNFENSS